MLRIVLIEILLSVFLGFLHFHKGVSYLINYLKVNLSDILAIYRCEFTRSKFCTVVICQIVHDLVFLCLVQLQRVCRGLVEKLIVESHERINLVEEHLCEEAVITKWLV